MTLPPDAAKRTQSSQKPHQNINYHEPMTMGKFVKNIHTGKEGVRAVLDAPSVDGSVPPFIK